MKPPTRAPVRSPNSHERDLYIYIYMEVSWNRGTPSSSILMGFSLVNHPFWVPPCMETTIYTYFLFFKHNFWNLGQSPLKKNWNSQGFRLPAASSPQRSSSCTGCWLKNLRTCQKHWETLEYHRDMRDKWDQYSWDKKLGIDIMMMGSMWGLNEIQIVEIGTYPPASSITERNGNSKRKIL